MSLTDESFGALGVVQAKPARPINLVAHGQCIGAKDAVLIAGTQRFTLEPCDFARITRPALAATSNVTLNALAVEGVRSVRRT